MAGLSIEGFTPLTEKEIIDRIHTRLLAFSPDMDLSTESPDGQLVEIFSFELAQAWNELSQVFHSYNPDVAIGAGLRNVGMITLWGSYSLSGKRRTRRSSWYHS